MTHLVVSNIHQCFELVKNCNLNKRENIRYSIQGFFSDRNQTVPAPVYEFLNNTDISTVLSAHTEAINALRELTLGSYNDYQHITISEPGVITLHSHTQSKYDIANKYIYNMDSVLDAGCSLGGIGLKLAVNNQINPNFKVILDNVTASELNVAIEIGGKLGLTNVVYTTESLTNLNIKVDMGLYFAIFHHLLRTFTFDSLMELVKSQVSKIAIIELPLQGDALLANIVAGHEDPWNNQFSALASNESLKLNLSRYFNVVDEIKMNYGSGNLNRVAFVCYL